MSVSTSQYKSRKAKVKRPLPAIPQAGKVVYVQSQAPRRRRQQSSVKSYQQPAQQKTNLMGLGGQLGGLLGGGIAGPAGSAVGSLIGSGLGALANYVGLGEYKVQRNILMEDPMRVKNRDPHSGVVIRHREYVADIITSSTIGGFKSQQFLLNPGNPQLFPFLAQVAANYEEYSFEGVIFEFKSMSADALNSTNTALGSVIMATAYDCTNAAFANKAEMENYEYGTSCKPSVNMIHPIECAPRQTAISTELYVQPGATTISSIPANQDPRLFFWGNFQVATTGFQAASVNIGELWVTYQVSFLKPKMWISLGNFASFAHITNAAGGVDSFHPMGNPGSAVTVSNTVGVVQSASSLTFPIQQYQQSYIISVFWTFLNGATTLPFLTITNGTAFLAQEWAPTPATFASSSLLHHIPVRSSGNGTAMVLTYDNSGVFGGGAASIDIRITQCANIMI